MCQMKPDDEKLLKVYLKAPLLYMGVFFCIFGHYLQIFFALSALARTDESSVYTRVYVFASKASCRLHVRVCDFASHIPPSAQQQTQQTAFFPPPPLTVNSLHSQDLRANGRERTSVLCFPCSRFLQHSPVPFRSVWVCMPASNSCLLFSECW